MHRCGAACIHSQTNSHTQTHTKQTKHTHALTKTRTHTNMFLRGLGEWLRDRCTGVAPRANTVKQTHTQTHKTNKTHTSAYNNTRAHTNTSNLFHTRVRRGAARSMHRCSASCKHSQTSRWCDGIGTRGAGVNSGHFGMCRRRNASW